jgi:hypothetical protein
VRPSGSCIRKRTAIPGLAAPTGTSRRCLSRMSSSCRRHSAPIGAPPARDAPHGAMEILAGCAGCPRFPKKTKPRSAIPTASRTRRPASIALAAPRISAPCGCAKAGPFAFRFCPARSSVAKASIPAPIPETNAGRAIGRKDPCARAAGLFSLTPQLPVLYRPKTRFVWRPPSKALIIERGSQQSGDHLRRLLQGKRTFH